MGFEFRHPDALSGEYEHSPLEKGRKAEHGHEYDRAEQHYLNIDNLLVREMTVHQLSSAWNSVNAGIVRAQEIVRQQPNLASARAELARQYYQKGLLHVQYLKTATGQYPKDFVFEEQEYYFKESLSQAQKALQLDPNLPEADLLISEIYVANARYDDALMSLKRLISKYPDYARGYYAIGKLYLDRKHYEKVERYLIRTIKLDPEFYDAYYLLGKFYLEQQWYDYAAYTFLEILRRKPNDTPSFDLLLNSTHKLGDSYVKQEEYEKAIHLFDEILKLRSSYPVYQSLQLAKAKKAEAALNAKEAAQQQAQEAAAAQTEEPSQEASQPGIEPVPQQPQPATEAAPEQPPQEILPEAEQFEPLPSPEGGAPQEQSASQNARELSLRSTPSALSRDHTIQMIRQHGFNHPGDLSSEGLSGAIHGNIQHLYGIQAVGGENVVVAQSTGLMWQTSGSPSAMNQRQAKAYIQQLNQSNYAGYTDWRLPTVEELASLLEFTKKNGDAYLDPVFDATIDVCWTADTVVDSDTVWVVDFQNGQISVASPDRMNRVKAVR